MEECHKIIGLWSFNPKLSGSNDWFGMKMLKCLVPVHCEFWSLNCNKIWCWNKLEMNSFSCTLHHHMIIKLDQSTTFEKSWCFCSFFIKEIETYIMCVDKDYKSMLICSKYITVVINCILNPNFRDRLMSIPCWLT